MLTFYDRSRDQTEVFLSMDTVLCKYQISSCIRWNYHIQDFALRGRCCITLLGAMTKTQKSSQVIPGGDNKVKVKNGRFIKTTLLLCSHVIHLPFVRLLVCLLFVVRRETLLPEDIASSSMHKE